MGTLGTDTGYYGDLSLEDALARLAEVGLRDVQVSAHHLETVEGGEDRFARVRAACDRLGITVWQVHADVELGPDPVHVADHLRWLHRAVALGAHCLITHASGDADYNTEDERLACLAINRDCLEEVSVHADKLGLRVAIENRLERPWATCRRFGARMKDLLELTDVSGVDNLGVCLDTSHTRVSRLSFADEIASCSGKLFATQLSDSDGDLQHRMPFTLEVDWGEVVTSLAEIGYDGLLSLDTGGDRNVSLEERDAQLLAVVERLEALLDG